MIDDILNKIEQLGQPILVFIDKYWIIVILGSIVLIVFALIKWVFLWNIIYLKNVVNVIKLYGMNLLMLIVVVIMF